MDFRAVLESQIGDAVHHLAGQIEIVETLLAFDRIDLEGVDRPRGVRRLARRNLLGGHDAARTHLVRGRVHRRGAATRTVATAVVTTIITTPFTAISTALLAPTIVPTLAAVLLRLLLVLTLAVGLRVAAVSAIAALSVAAAAAVTAARRTVAALTAGLLTGGGGLLAGELRHQLLDESKRHCCRSD